MNQRTTMQGSLSLKNGVGLSMHIDDKSLENFKRQVYGIISAAGEGAKALVEETTMNIRVDSERFIPKDTETLLESGYSKVTEHMAFALDPTLGGTKVFTQYVGTVGYGDDQATGTINPKTGLRPSQYAWKVHEDMSAKHPNGGQAKFLERAYREYVNSEFGPRMVELERTVYTGKKYKPNFRYGLKSKTFTGWVRSTKIVRTKDKPNLDKLMDTYNGGE